MLTLEDVGKKPSKNSRYTDSEGGVEVIMGITAPRGQMFLFKHECSSYFAAKGRVAPCILCRTQANAVRYFMKAHKNEQ